LNLEVLELPSLSPYQKTDPFSYGECRSDAVGWIKGRDGQADSGSAESDDAQVIGPPAMIT
jgi:hypothetical protein